MATNRDIVSTRKLNKKNKARLGRGGDTKIRKVDGRDSHVNALEAYAIDANRKAGEEYTKRVGSGAINPLTGMPEYQTDPTQLSYDEIAGMSSEEYQHYLASWGISTDELKYFEDPRRAGRKELGFAAKEQTLATDAATRGREMGMTNLGQDLGLAREGLGIQDVAASRQAGVARAGVQAGYAGARESLSKGVRGGMSQARAGAESAAAKSGFARSGTVTGALSQQMKGLTQDYTQGMGAAGRQAAIGMAGIAAQQETAAATYGLGMEKASTAYAQGKAGITSDYMTAVGGADLGYQEKVQGIKSGEMDKFYGAMGEHGGEAVGIVSGNTRTDPNGDYFTRDSEDDDWKLISGPSYDLAELHRATVD